MLEIDKRDLLNMLRHAYLCGSNDRNPVQPDRDQILEGFVKDFEEKGGCSISFGEYPSSCDDYGCPT